jgi:ribonuclease P/MRP protein subunit POP1
LDKRRHDLALPGTRLRPLAQDDRIPVILVAKQNAFKLLFPRGWAQPLLHSVVYTATMLGGLEERRAQHREAGVPCFPEQYGNVCDAGREFEVSVAKEDERRWSRKPPGKRIDHPTWTPEWEKVLRLDEEESMSAKGVWLLPSALAAHADKAEGAVNAFRKARGMAPLPSGFSASAVVHVKLEVEGRGSPGRMAEIHALGDGERAEWIEAVCEGADRLHDGVSHAQLVRPVYPASVSS